MKKVILCLSFLVIGLTTYASNVVVPISNVSVVTEVKKTCQTELSNEDKSVACQVCLTNPDTKAMCCASGETCAEALWICQEFC